MFRKLLSNLPFNPSLINQVSFYAKRLHQEEQVRRSGVVLVVLAMLLQIFAVVRPPQQSYANQANDIVPGGISSIDDAYRKCSTDAYNFKKILGAYGVTCENIKASTQRSLRSTEYGKDINSSLYSLGHIPYDKPGETPFPVAGVGTLYMRPLWSWDTGAYSTYTALEGRNAFGVKFFVLFNCGNLVIIGRPAAPTATPTPIVTKPNPRIKSKTTLAGMPADKSTVAPGDKIGYRIYFENTGNAAATNVFIEDSTPKDTSFVPGSQGSGAADRYSYVDTVYPGHGQEPHVYWAYYSLPAGATNYYVDFTVRVNAGTPDGTQICNTAYIRSNETPQAPSPNQICHTVRAGTTVTPTPVTPTPTPTVVVATPAPCTSSKSQTDIDSCIEKHKTARNDTQNIANADKTTAAAGDTIIYSLTAKNNANVAAKDFVVEENLADVLEYADVVNLNGGSINANKVVSWPGVTILSGDTITKKITVKIKDKIPETPSPSSNPGSFDLLLTNVYGDAVNIRLPGSVAKIVEQTNTTLPNTGPGTTVMIAVSITMIASYFFARSRLMAKELDMVREEYAAAGGV